MNCELQTPRTWSVRIDLQRAVRHVKVWNSWNHDFHDFFMNFFHEIMNSRLVTDLSLPGNSWISKFVTLSQISKNHEISWFSWNSWIPNPHQVWWPLPHQLPLTDLGDFSQKSPKIQDYITISKYNKINKWLRAHPVRKKINVFMIKSWKIKSVSKVFAILVFGRHNRA